MKELNENEELRQSAPTLFGLPKQDPFVVKEGFFECFPHEVQALANAPQRTHYGIWMKRAAFALPMLALIAFGIHSISDGTQPEVNTIAAITISPEAAAQYMASTDLDTPELLAELPVDEWPVFDAVTVQLSTDEAMAYLDHENIDLNDLIYNP